MTYIEPLMIGCSKFYNGKGVISLFADEVKRLGGKALLIGGPSSVDRVWNIVADDCKKAGVEVVLNKHTEACTRANAESYAAKAKELGCNVIVGVGGGKCIDQAKSASVFADMPIVTVPTSVATCVASSMTCVMYTAAGTCDGQINLKKEIDVCIADEDLIATAPNRMLASGMLDSMAKLPEVMQKVENMDPADIDVIQTIQISNSKDIWNFLFHNSKELYDNKENSKNFSDVVITNLIQTSLVSGFAAGRGQLAIAHGVYNNMRNYFTEQARPFLHGELVAVGVLVQMHYNGNSTDEIEAVRALMKSMDMPATLHEIGLEPTEENLSLMCRVLAEDTKVTEPDRIKAVRAALDYNA
ncbi:MAG: iron-containing alcohol dehydrogenase [Firmicutes bacterium]|nr:iron-containing alcohol dehydrogenase [Bacillota bacterium]